MRQRLEDCIAELEEQYQSALDGCRADRAAYDALVRQAAAMEPTSFEHEMLRQEMTGRRAAMARRRWLLDQICRALETERAALDALNAGGLLASLRQYMPDAAELAALLDFSAEAAEDMRLQREAMASAVRENSGERVLPGAGAAAAPAAEERAAAEWTGEASAGFC